MYIIHANNINDLLQKVCEEITKCGTKIESRNGECSEIRPVAIEVCDPMKRTLLFPGRGNNPFASLFENLWVLAAKDNSIEHLKQFIPRAPDYSDDGRTWRAGYPERLRKFGFQEVDQIKYVYDTLKADTNSRQAVMNLWNADLDCYDVKHPSELLKTGDRPCSQHLGFTIRDNVLDCLFLMRSNDAIFGLTGINFYEFTTIQEILAGMLGCEIGKFNYISNSLHVYKAHYSKCKTLAEDTMSAVANSYGLEPFTFYDKDTVVDYDTYFKFLERIYNVYLYGVEEDMVKLRSLCKPMGGDFSGIMTDILLLLTLYKDLVIHPMSNYEVGRYLKDEYVFAMRHIRDTDLKLACHWHIMKKFKYIDGGRAGLNGSALEIKDSLKYNGDFYNADV